MNKIIKKTVSVMMICTMLAYTMPVMAYTNEETIYSKLNASGNVYKNIASIIEEKENGTENTQEEIDKELPIESKITYNLDGKNISAEEIVGKSGKVKISMEYENKLGEEINVGGKQDTVYTPFLVISGVVIDNEMAKDIEISNGKIINNGNKAIAIGFALPGMKESLNLDKDIPNKIEITMQATDFELGNIMSFATPKILEEGSLDNIYDDLDEVYSQVYDLEDASKQLEDGTITLRDGIITLNNGANDLNNGAQTLNNGAQTLNNGAKDLKNGIDTLKAGSSKVNEGASTLKTGASEYSANSNLLNENMQKLSVGANTLNSSYADLDAGIKQMQDGLPTVASGVSSVKTALTDQVLINFKKLNAGLSSATGVTPSVTSTIDTGAVSTSINDAVNAVHAVNKTATASVDLSAQIAEIDGQIASLEGTKAGLMAMVDTVPEVQGAISAIDTSIGTLNASKGILANGLTATATVDLGAVESSLTNAQNAVANMQVQTVSTPSAQTSGLQDLVDGYAGITSALETQVIPNLEAIESGANILVAGVNNLSAGSDSVKAGITNLSTSTTTISGLNNKLNEAAQSIAKGANDLADGTGSLDAGVTNLVDGSNRLTDGANSLANGASTLLNGTNTLANGTRELLDGGNNLVEGVQKFNTEGIRKITDLVNIDVRNTETRIRKMENLSNEYKRFSSEVTRDDIKFISIVDSIKKK